MHILVIDVGTTRVKVAVVAENGEIVDFESEYIRKEENPTEQNPNKWLDSVSKLTKKIVDHKKIDIVSVTGNMHALLPIDKNGEPLINAWLWNDIRSQKTSEWLTENYAKEISRRFFNPPIPGFPLSKLVRFREEYPDEYKKTYKLLQPKDFVVYKLTGKLATDVTDASGTLMFNMKNKEWDTEFMKELNISVEILPGIYKSQQLVGDVSEEGRKLTNIKKGTPIVAGAGDLITASLGNGVNNETFVLVYGTAGQLLTTDSKLVKSLSNRIFAFEYVNPEEYLYLGTVPAGGYSLDWFSELTKLPKEEIISKAERANNKSSLTYMPFTQGTGTPHMDYRPMGGFNGIDSNDSLDEYSRAVIEGPIFSLKESHEVMTKELGSREKLVAQSLAAKIPFIKTVVENLFDEEIYVPETKESSIIGGAILGAVGITKYRDITQAQKQMIKLKKCEKLKGGDKNKDIEERFSFYQNITDKLFSKKEVF
ncbi:MAG: FGGY family carbohydrate kinase [Thermotogota bacterium]|nr:FGGY family carbohydrate kinase [Thermotogota bacterium]